MNCKDSSPKLLWNITNISHPWTSLLIFAQAGKRGPHVLEAAESAFASESAMDDFGVLVAVSWQACPECLLKISVHAVLRLRVYEKQNSAALRASELTLPSLEIIGRSRNI